MINISIKDYPDDAGESAEAAVSFVQKGAVLHDPYSDARCLPNLT